MLVRAHELAALALAVVCVPAAVPTAATEDPAWARHPLLGRCFPTAGDFIEAVAGPQGRKDENIRLGPAGSCMDGSVWIVDQTPQTNYQWYLLQPGEPAELCLTLFVPAAAQVTLGAVENAQTAYAKTQASPNFPVKEVRFARPRQARLFHPVACAELRLSGEDRERMPVQCASLFE